MKQMVDKDLRKVLCEHLESKLEIGDRILNELGICAGSAIADVVLVNEGLHCYEIKSDKDTLTRLERNQIEHYNGVFDSVTVVVGEKFKDEVFSVVPDWWGIYFIENHEVKILREPRRNRFIIPFFLAQLIWRDEAYDILKQDGLSKGLSNKPRDYLWERLAEYYSIKQLKDIVIDKLHSRNLS